MLLVGKKSQRFFLINLQQPQSSSVYLSELPSLSLILRSFDIYNLDRMLELSASHISANASFNNHKVHVLQIYAEVELSWFGSFGI